jgi:hypothetical protein
MCIAANKAVCSAEVAIREQAADAVAAFDAGAVGIGLVVAGT